MPKRELTQQEIDQLHAAIRTANSVKEVINSKGWREVMAAEAVRMKDRIQRQSYSGIDPATNQYVPMADPQIAIKGTYMIAGIDMLLLYFNTLVEAGENAKKYFKEPENAA